MQLPCHIQREFQVHERLFGMMDGACRHLEIGAVVVEVVDGRADEHAEVKGEEGDGSAPSYAGSTLTAGASEGAASSRGASEPA